MKLLRGFEDRHRWRGGVVAIGNFDGVHRGHQRMIRCLREQADSAGVPAVVLTFAPHPIQLLRPNQAPPSLSTLERKAELLGKFGVDCVIAYPTDQQLLDLPPRAFFDSFVTETLQATALVEGGNFFFGKNRGGNVEVLKAFCDESGIGLTVVNSVEDSRGMVSSSRIRACLAAGELADANALLGHSYQLQGIVVAGAGRGRQLGFPTANLVDIPTLTPADGVYAGRVALDGDACAAAIHIGSNPTFKDGRQKVEVHIIDLAVEQDLYERTLTVDLLERIRGIVQFDNPDELCEQIAIDIAEARRIATQ